MLGEALFQFLIARWETTEPDDRPRVFRELCAEASAAYEGDAAAPQFMGHFVGQALQVFPDIDDAERRSLLLVARKAVDESEINLGASSEEGEEGEEDHRALTKAELRKKRKEAKAEREALLDEFNARYAVVKEGGTALVFEDCYDDVLKRQFYDRLKPASLQLLYAARSVCTRVDDDGKRHFQPAAKWWLNHPDRRTFLNGTTFMPGKNARDGFLNLWRGFNFEPRPGSWEKLKAHIRDVICSGNGFYFQYLMGWMARAVQLPSARAEVAVVLRGDTRSGKGTLGHALRRLFGQHGMHISSSKHLVGSFNEHLRDCVFLFADEAFFANDRANISTLKAIITEEVLTIEAKYINAVQCPSRLHVLMASNDAWVIPAAIGEERFFVLDVPNTYKGDHRYFGEISAELEAGGYEAMLHDLLQHDLTGFNIRDVPKTAALTDQKHYSLGTTFAWLREIIERGFVFESKLGLEDELHKWMDPVSIRLLYASYRGFARDRNERHPLHQGALEQFLADKMGWVRTRPRQYRIIEGEHLRGKIPDVVVAKARPPCFRVGTLADARTAFEVATGLPIEAPTDDELPTIDDDETNVVPF